MSSGGNADDGGAWPRKVPTGLVPRGLIVLLGTSAHPMMRQYRWYYPLPLLPFVLYGILEFRRGPWAQAQPRLRDLLCLAALLLFPLVGGGYLKFLPVDVQRHRVLEQGLQWLAQGQGLRCVQPVLFPHTPYALRPEPLSPACASSPGALTLVNPELDPLPFTREDIQELIATHPAERLGQGFFLLFAAPPR